MFMVSSLIKPISFPINLNIHSSDKYHMITNPFNTIKNLKDNNLRLFCSIIITIIFFVIIFISWFSIQAAGVVHIVDDDGNTTFSSIQEAVNVSEDGDTIMVHGGLYKENVVVTKHINLIAVENETPIIDAGGFGSVLNISKVDSEQSETMTISGFILMKSGGKNHPDFDSGIIIDRCNYITIQSCVISKTEIGICILNSANIIIIDNFLNNNNAGIQFHDLGSKKSRLIQISYNYINNSGIGVMLEGIEHTLAFNSILHSTEHGVKLLCDNSYIHNNTIGNGSSGGIYIYSNNQNNVISNNTIFNNSDTGIKVQGHSNTIMGNIISNNRIGLQPVAAVGATNNIVKDNCLVNNGFHMAQWITDYTLTMENNTMNGKRIVFLQGIHGSPKEPIIIENDASTIYLFDCSDILIRNNTISDGIHGIHIFSCRNITIRDNIIKNNYWRGIFIIGNNCLVISNEIRSNQNGIIIDSNGKIVTKGITISENKIYGNQEFGLHVNGITQSIDATLNWWGDDSGPYNKYQNPNGKGDNISDKVEFNPWLMGNGGKYSFNNESKNETFLPFFPVIAIGIGLSGICGLAFLRQNIRISFLLFISSPLYSRLKKNDLLDNEKRSIAYNHIREHPGINYSTLLKKMPFGNGTLVHHLAILQTNSMIRVRKKFNRIYYFSTDISNETLNQSIQRPLSSNQKSILNYLSVVEFASSQEIQNQCSLGQSSVDYSLNQLINDGLIMRYKDDNREGLMMYQIRNEAPNRSKLRGMVLKAETSTKSHSFFKR